MSSKAPKYYWWDIYPNQLKFTKEIWQERLSAGNPEQQNTDVYWLWNLANE